MNKKAYLLISIEEYGKFIAYCKGCIIYCSIDCNNFMRTKLLNKFFKNLLTNSLFYDIINTSSEGGRQSFPRKQRN